MLITHLFFVVTINLFFFINKKKTWILLLEKSNQRLVKGCISQWANSIQLNKQIRSQIIYLLLLPLRVCLISPSALTLHQLSSYPPSLSSSFVTPACQLHLQHTNPNRSTFALICSLWNLFIPVTHDDYLSSFQTGFENTWKQKLKGAYKSWFFFPPHTPHLLVLSLWRPPICAIDM